MKTFMDYLDMSGDGVLQENEFVTIDVYIDILEEEEGLAGWAIALIVITCLIIACLIGYIIAVCCCGVANCFAYCCACCCKGGRSSSTTNNKEKVIYDDRTRSTSRRTRMLAIEDRPREERTRVLALEDRPREEKKKDVILMIKNKEDNRSMLAIADGMEESIKSRNNRNMMLALENGKQAGRRESLDTLAVPLPPVHKKKIGRDPTLYIAGDEEKPDPEEALMLTNDGVTYKDGPSLKVKRDPTMYYEGRRTTTSELPAMFEKQGVKDLPLNPGATRGVQFQTHVESDANMRASNASFYYDESYYSDVHTEDPSIVSGMESSRQSNRYKTSKKSGRDEEYDMQCLSVGGSKTSKKSGRDEEYDRQK